MKILPNLKPNQVICPIIWIIKESEKFVPFMIELILKPDHPIVFDTMQKKERSIPFNFVLFFTFMSVNSSEALLTLSCMYVLLGLFFRDHHSKWGMILSQLPSIKWNGLHCSNKSLNHLCSQKGN